MKIALIGPGIMPIPPTSWGAVEILIWQYKCFLEKHGHHVDVYNTKDLESVSKNINVGNYDFVHLQYDEYAGFFSNTLDVPFCTTTHYGYIMKPDFWDSYYTNIYEQTFQSTSILALSENIMNKYLQSGYGGYIDYLRNGAEVYSFDFDSSSGNNKALVLGKIEPRKRQSDIASRCNSKCEIDFVGPIVDSNFRENETCRYLGEWSKPELYQNLTNYSTLVLFSDGEAAPLVVPEALSAGLSVVVSECASANLNRELPYVTVIPDGDVPDDFSDIVRKSCDENIKHRGDIRKMAEEYFDWDVIVDEYVDKIGDTI